MLQGIKNIIFDLGGVIYAVDYQKTIHAFEALGVEDFEGVYAKVGQVNLFDDLEEGKISKAVFFDGIKQLSGSEISEKEITYAWNAMLLEFMSDALECLKSLKGQYRIFLLSNTNEIHIQEIENRVGEAAFADFCALFEQVYLSHDLGLRKPNTEVFTHIVNEQGLNPAETLFIDDSIQHVQGALKAGIKAHHLTDGERIAQLLP